MAKQAAVYILASRSDDTLYMGVTRNLISRVWQHRNLLAEGVSSRYAIHKLVYFELHADLRQAIAREARLKTWQREWKLRVIEEQNPQWIDLWNQVLP